MDPNSGKNGLCNKLSREQLQERLNTEDFKRITVSFYRYVIIEDLVAMRDELYRKWDARRCLGRIYIAREGINAQMSIPEYEWDAFAEELHAIPEFRHIPFKIAVEENGRSFLKLIIRIRRKIVADGLADDEYDVANVGRHLSAREWNEALDQQGTIVVDMRNHYESEVGRFEGAITPKAETYREELPEVLEKLRGREDRKVLLYCTGGIRCEKASAYLKHHGFRDVNQLHGGIIDYMRQLKFEELPNKYCGKNFVFDDRLGERISEEVISCCHQCGKPCDTQVNCANKMCNLLFIQCEECAAEYACCCSDTCSEMAALPEEKQKELRKGQRTRHRFHSHRKFDHLPAQKHA